MKKIFLILIFALLLSGCAREEPEEQGFRFVYNGIVVTMDAEAGPILYQLGKPVSCTQTPSCAFEGMDTTYYHGGFYITTYPGENTEYISGLWFADDTVATEEGIRIGDSRENVEAAYGPDCFNGDACILTRGNTRLTIVLTEDKVSSVQYEVIFE